jgi:hypothetical protein
MAAPLLVTPASASVRVAPAALHFRLAALRHGACLPVDGLGRPFLRRPECALARQPLVQLLLEFARARAFHHHQKYRGGNLRMLVFMRPSL